jgi:hypothetical protein
VFFTGTTSANFSDNAILFGSFASANQPLPYLKPGSTATIVVPPVAGGGQAPEDAKGGVALGPPFVTCRFLWIYNDGPGIMQVSWDGTNVHDEIQLNDVGGGPGGVASWHQYEDLKEGGCAVRFKPANAPSLFRIVGW